MRERVPDLLGNSRALITVPIHLELWQSSNMSHLQEKDRAWGKEVSFERELVPEKPQLWEINSQHSW